jgi:hypothetical protein
VSFAACFGRPHRCAQRLLLARVGHIDRCAFPASPGTPPRPPGSPLWPLATGLGSNCPPRPPARLEGSQAGIASTLPAASSLHLVARPPSYTARWKQPWRPAESPIASYGQRHGGRLTVAVGYEPAMAGGHIRLATLPSPEAALNEACPGSGPFAVSALAEIRVASLATASGMAHNRPKARVSKIATGLYRNIRMTLTQRERSRSDCPPGGTVVSCGRQRRSLRTAYQ